MFIFSWGIIIWLIYPIVYRKKIVIAHAWRMSHVDQTNPIYQTAFIARVLPLDQLNKTRLTLVLNAIIDNDDCLWMVVQTHLNRTPQVLQRKTVIHQKTTNRVVAHANMVIWIIRSCVIYLGRNQVFYVISLYYHPNNISLFNWNEKVLTVNLWNHLPNSINK